MIFIICQEPKRFKKKQTLKTDVIFTIVFWGFILRIQSFNQLEKIGYYYAHKSVVATVIGDELNCVIKQNMLKVKSQEKN